MSDHIAIRLASENEAPACLALLSEVRDVPAEFLIARANGEFAGAAAIVWRNWSNPGGFPIHIHVLKAHRGKGMGRALLNHAVSLASGDTDGLWPVKPVPEDSEAAQFMQACGFQLRRKHLFFEAKVENLLSQVSPVVARLRRHKRIPENARIIPLHEAPIDQVGWLVSADFGGAPIQSMAKLQQRLSSTGTIKRDCSNIAMLGGEVAGCLIFQIEERGGRDIAVVDVRVVAPEQRNGWASLMTLEAGLLRCQALGVNEFAIDCDDTNRDTLSVSRRSKAIEVKRNALYYYAATA